MKSKYLIVLAIVVALLVGISYLSFQISGATQPSTSAKAPSTPKSVAKAPGTPTEKDAQLTRSVVATSPSTAPVPAKNGKRDFRHQTGLPAPVVSKSPLLIQDFEECIIPPTNWTVVVSGNPYTWEVGTYDPYEGSCNAVCFYDETYTSTQDEWLISPVINLTTKGQAWHLYFYWMMSYYWAVDPYDNYELEVWISTDGGTTFPTKLWCEDDVGVFSNWTWYKADVNLAAYLTETTVKLAFRYYGYDGAEADVDYITVDTEPIGRCCYGDPQSPSCADVTPSACSGLGGTFTDGLNCTDNPCPVAGVGENCASAIAIASLPYNTTGNSCAYVNDYDETCPYSGGAAPDVVYSYSPATDQAINIDLCNSLYDTKVFVYEDVCPSSPFYACNDDACGSDGYKSAIYGLSLSAGHTYYIVVDGYGSGCGDYDLSVTEAGAAPPNDNCDGAIPVSAPLCPDVVTVSGTTIGATIDCPGVLDWNAVWYEFELPYASNKLTIDYCPTAIPIYQIGIVLYNSCPVICSNYILASAYQFVTCPNTNTGPQMWWSGLPAGTYYLPVAVWDYSMNPFNDFVFTACVEPLQTPDNDNCANATAVGDVIDLPFSTEAATFDGPGGCQTAANVWYCYTATCDGNAHVDLCGSSYDTKLAAYEGCSCWGTMLACNDDACGGTLQSEISFSVVMGQQYLIEVGGFSTATGSGDLSISCALPPPNDECTGAPVINTFPTDVYGTTLGAGVDCPDVLAWNAVWYQFDLPYACNNVTVNYCLTDWSISQIGIVLYNSCPPNCPAYIGASGYQWLSCDNGTSNPEIWWNNLAGPASYWIPVYPFASANFGFTVSVEECVPCVLTCPPNGIPEGEPECWDGYVDEYNGGCNSSPYIWQSINCGDTICGTSGVYGGAYYRDTDWFRVEAGEGDFTWTCVAEFPVLLFIMDAGSEDCVDYTQLAYNYTYDVCDTISVYAYVTGGVYWVWVGPVDWGNYPCGALSEYVAWVDCVPFGPKIAVDPMSFDQTLNPTGACSSATKNLLISSVGGEDLNWSIAENPSVNWLAESPTSGTLPPGETATLNVSFDAGGMAPGDNNTSLEITSNAPKGVVPVPVHLKVELAPEINVIPRLWMPVIPGCTIEKRLRVDNLGAGDLRFEVKVKGSPPPLGAPKGMHHQGFFNQAPKRNTEDMAENAALTSATAKNLMNKGNPVHQTAPSKSPKGGSGKDAGDTLFYQRPYEPDEAWSFYTSDIGAGYKCYENFADLAAPIGDIHWWALPLICCWDNCDPAGMEFEITFYSDDPYNTTDMPPTAVVCTYSNVVPTYEFYNLYSGYYNAYYFSVNLDPPCELQSGWVSIQSTYSPNSCWSLLSGCPEGWDYFSYQEGSGPIYEDLALLLTEGAPACPFTVAPDEGTVPAESFFDVFLTFDGTTFEVCGVETSVCYLVFTSNDCDESQVVVPVYMWAARGDVNGDCKIDVVDVVFLLNYIFIGGPDPVPLCVGDVNRSGGDPDSDDALYLISYLFMYGPPPEIPAAPSR